MTSKSSFCNILVTPKKADLVKSKSSLCTDEFYCFVNEIVANKQTNKILKHNSVKNVHEMYRGLGKYSTAAVKSAPFYLKNGMSWRKMLLHKVPFILILRSTLSINLFRSGDPFDR